ncbi:UNKNOWN [Stylonychia lemnae]|uniref:Uncharacterized protein n=1 Tax=Stylonychia lemnae TaxID=5949 RepID=A0A078A6M1_STYLE|nr:UNKNOWN [Stylonychia lemnae]|eukprot:CDW77242.1 UNKNOWN [Stylonychia lemnae]
MSLQVTSPITAASQLSEIFQDQERTLLLFYNLGSAIVNSLGYFMPMGDRRRRRQTVDTAQYSEKSINVQDDERGIRGKVVNISQLVKMILEMIFRTAGLITNFFGIYTIAGVSGAFLIYNIFSAGFQPAAMGFIMEAVQLIQFYLTIVEPNLLTQQYLFKIA